MMLVLILLFLSFDTLESMSLSYGIIGDEELLVLMQSDSYS